MIVTNYNVIKCYLDPPTNETPIGNLEAIFGYDSPGMGKTVELGNAQCFSRTGNTANTDNLDIAFFSFNDTGLAPGLLMDLSSSKIDFMFKRACWDAANKMLEEGLQLGYGLIIGHPRGSYKRVSMVSVKFY